MKIQISGINISVGLWTASKTCVALLRGKCLQFEVCHGWFLLTGEIRWVDKDMRDNVDMSSVFSGGPREKGSTSHSSSINIILIAEKTSHSQTEAVVLLDLLDIQQHRNINVLNYINWTDRGLNVGFFKSNVTTLLQVFTEMSTSAQQLSYCAPSSGVSDAVQTVDV